VTWGGGWDVRGMDLVLWQAGAPGCTLPPLKAATVALAPQSVKLMFGICAEDQAAGVRALKAWTEGLGLPKVPPRENRHSHDCASVWIWMGAFEPCAFTKGSACNLRYGSLQPRYSRTTQTPQLASSPHSTPVCRLNKRAREQAGNSYA